MTRAATWRIAGGVVIGLLFATLIFPAIRLRSNCGGNSAALSACKVFIIAVRFHQPDDGQSPFSFQGMNPEDRDDVLKLPGKNWIEALLLARTEGIRIDAAGPRQVVIVCDQAYGNVPQRRFGSSPMMHAVGYSPGETGLITPEEYAALDLSGFVDLATLSQ
jgi:hypothetical protein